MYFFSGQIKPVSIFSLNKPHNLIFYYLVVAFLLVFFTQSASADIASGTAWLKTQQQSNGAYGNETDISTEFQATSEVINTYQILGEEVPASTQQTFKSYAFDNTETLARKLISGLLTSQESTLVVTELLARQNVDGGFGEFEGYDSTPLDAAFVLNALGKVQSNNTESIGHAVSYLLNEQAADGGFLHSSVNQNSVYETALASIALQHFRFNYNLTTAIDGASQYLLNNQQAEGDWGSAWETAYALLALVPVTSDVQTYQSGVQNLKTAQATDGSWNQDVYQTALALRAIHTAENVQVPQDPTTGSYTGQLFNAENGQPLPDATIKLTDVSGFEVTSSSDGSFSLEGIAPGEHTLSYSAAGFTSATQTATIVVGKFTSLGTIQLTPLVDKGVVFGMVRDAETGQPVAAVTINITGSTTATVITNSHGLFSVEVDPGTVSISTEISGYDPVSGSADIVAGQRLNFSPLLNLTGTTPAVTTVKTKVTVVDATTNLPIEGVLVSIAGTSINGLTNNEGKLSLDNITAGSLTIEVSATGYQTVSASTIAPAGSVIDLGVVSLIKTAVTTKRTVKGFVTDAVTGNPISGATVKIEGASISVITNAKGYYLIEDTRAKLFNLLSSAVGYLENKGEVSIDQPGEVTVNIQLVQAQISKVNIISASTKETEYISNSSVDINVDIENKNQIDKKIRIYLIVSNQQDEIVDQFLVKTSQIAGVLDNGIELLPALSKKKLLVNWFTGFHQAGIYKIKIQAISSQDNQLLSVKEIAVKIKDTLGIGGGVSVFPPIIQSGSTTRVKLSALVRNNGNKTVFPGSVKLSITQSDNDVVELFTKVVNAPEIPIGKSINLDFGGWLPTHNGSLVVKIRYVDSAVEGVLFTKLYVGDKANAEITVNQSSIPVGTQTVHAKIKLSGVDVTTGSSSDPLFNLVKKSIEKGGEFVAREGVAWHQRNRCLGCHIQSQSLFGLSESLGKADIDLDASRFLFNSISTAQNDNGSLYLSHPSFTKTQTTLNLWGLSAWPERLASFISRYQAAKYLDSHKSLNGEQVYWIPDYTNGWWRNSISFTSTAMIGLSQLINDSQLVSFEELDRYVLSSDNPVPVIPANQISDMEFNPSGDLFILNSNSNIIYEVNIETGNKKVFTDSLPTGTTGLAISSAGKLFVVGSHGRLIQVNEDGSLIDIINIGGNLHDIEINSQNDFYVSTQNKVYKYSLNGDLLGTIESNLFGSLEGLAIDVNDNVLVADSTRRTIFNIDKNNEVSIYTSGLNSNPHTIVANHSSKGLFISNQNHSKIVYVNSGVAQNVVGGSGYYSLAIDKNDELWVSQGSSIKLIQKLKFKATDLDDIKSDLVGGVKYLLSSHTDNNSSNIVHAMRLQALIASRKNIENTNLLSEINVAIGIEDTLLRNRQQTNGGWGSNNGNSSDPLVTAMVGIALDGLHPSPSDPVIRRTVQYLLDTQRADSSWSNVNNGFSTRLSSTSFVMAFMPKALERLGGIDVDLSYSVPANSSLANPSINPTSIITNLDGSKTYQWVLDGVTGEGREINFDLVLSNLKPNESRAIASDAFFTFRNTFNGEIVRSDINIPNVLALSKLSLVLLSSDKIEYNANTNVDITLGVANTSLSTATGTIRLRIEKAGQKNAIEILPEIKVIDLKTGMSRNLLSTWNTKTYFPNDYEIHASLFNESGEFVNDKKIIVSIVSNNPEATLRITTDKPIYNTSDQLTLGSLSHNLTANVLINAATVKLKLMNPDGSVNAEIVQTVGDLASGNIRQLNSIQPLDSVKQGTYTVEGELLDADQKVLATAQTQFMVAEQLDLTISGQVQVAQQSVFAGAPQSCINTVNNNGSLSLDNAVFRQVLVNVDKATETTFADQQVNAVTAGSQYQFTSDIDTSSLVQGQYSCVLQRQDGTQWQTLAFQFFKVDMLAMSASLNATQYPANTPVDISLKVDNPTDVDFSGKVKLTVVDEAANVITELSSVVAQVPANKSVNLSANWNTATTLAGNYKIVASLLNGAGQSIELHGLPFEITAVIKASLDLTIDQPRYLPGEQVKLAHQVSNTTLNKPLANATLKTVVKNATGTVVFTKDTPLDTLAVGANKTIALDFALPFDAALGTYRVESQIVKGTEQLAVTSKAFDVIGLGATLTLQTDKPSYLARDTVKLTQVVKNTTVDKPLANATLKTVVKNATGTVVYTKDTPLDTLAAGASKTVALDFALAADAALGTYSVESQVVSGTQQLAVVSRSFDVVALGATLTLQTDKPSYLAKDTVKLTQVVKNTTVDKPLANATLKTVVKNATGTVVYTKDTPLDTLAAGASKTVALDFALAADAALGTYSVESQVVKGSAKLAVISRTFEVVVLNITASLSVETDKPAYFASDTVKLVSLVKNTSETANLENAQLKTIVKDSAGLVVFSKDTPLNKLASNETQSVALQFDLPADAPLGSYIVSSEIVDSQNKQLVQEQSTFKVKADASQAIKGTVTVLDKEIKPGGKQQCISHIENTSDTDIADLAIRQIVKPVSATTELGHNDSTQLLAKHSVSELIYALDALDMPVGEYQCILQAKIGGVYTTLDSSIFKVSNDIPVQKVSVLVTPDKPDYEQGNVVKLSNLVKNLTPAIPLQNALLRLSITDPDGKQVFKQDQPLQTLSARRAAARQASPVLAARADQSIVIDFTLPADAVLGDYTVTSQVLSDAQQVLASDTAVFRVNVAVAPIPALSQWNLLLLMLTLGLAAYWQTKKRRLHRAKKLSIN